MRKLFVLIVIVLLGIQIVNAVVKIPPFPDVPLDYIYFDAVVFSKERRIVVGFSDGLFRPDREITRAEFTKIVIYEFFDESDILNCNSQYFPDVDYTNKFFHPICMAREHGIVHGYTDGYFRPDWNIDWGQAMKVISNGFGFTDENTPVPPDDKFRYNIEAIQERGGLAQTYVSPSLMINRGETVQTFFLLKAFFLPQTSDEYCRAAYGDWYGYNTTCYGEIEEDYCQNQLVGVNGMTTSPCLPGMNCLHVEVFACMQKSGETVCGEYGGEWDGSNCSFSSVPTAKNSYRTACRDLGLVIYNDDQALILVQKGDVWVCNPVATTSK